MLLMDFAFNYLNLRKLYWYAFSENTRSIACAKKCGGVEEAVLPKHYYRKGKYMDQTIMAIYKKAWEKIWKKFDLR